MTVETLMMACADKHCDFKPMKLERRDMGDFDVVVDIKYCGVCHSDLSIASGHMDGVNKCKYPCVPGHEMAGICVDVGAKVTKVKLGDKVGVGCMVDSCGTCKACKRGEQQFCSRKYTATYAGATSKAKSPYGYTLGGYTRKMVVDENFAVIIPEDYPLEFAGPIMCAGITMYDPMQRQGMGKGSKVGIAGLGGLGQMGIKIAKAIGCEVTVISRSKGKEELAMKCGADHYVVSSSPESMEAAKGSLDLILNTIPVYHDYVQYHSLLKRRGGRQVLLGLHAGLAGAMFTNKIVCNKSRVIHSEIGGMKATQEVMDICAEHKIYPEIKVMACHELNTIYENLDKSNDEGIRFVLDIENTLNDDTASKCVAPPPVLAPASGIITYPRAVREIAWLLFTGKWL